MLVVLRLKTLMSCICTRSSHAQFLRGVVVALVCLRNEQGPFSCYTQRDQAILIRCEPQDAIPVPIKSSSPMMTTWHKVIG